MCNPLEVSLQAKPDHEPNYMSVDDLDVFGSIEEKDFCGAGSQAVVKHLTTEMDRRLEENRKDEERMILDALTKAKAEEQKKFDKKQADTQAKADAGLDEPPASKLSVTVLKMQVQTKLCHVY